MDEYTENYGISEGIVLGTKSIFYSLACTSSGNGTTLQLTYILWPFEQTLCMMIFNLPKEFIR